MLRGVTQLISCSICLLGAVGVAESKKTIDSQSEGSIKDSMAEIMKDVMIQSVTDLVDRSGVTEVLNISQYAEPISEVLADAFDLLDDLDPPFMGEITKLTDQALAIAALFEDRCTDTEFTSLGNGPKTMSTEEQVFHRMSQVLENSSNKDSGSSGSSGSRKICKDIPEWDGKYNNPKHPLVYAALDWEILKYFDFSLHLGGADNCEAGDVFFGMGLATNITSIASDFVADKLTPKLPEEKPPKKSFFAKVKERLRNIKKGIKEKEFKKDFAKGLLSPSFSLGFMWDPSNFGGSALNIDFKRDAFMEIGKARDRYFGEKISDGRKEVEDGGDLIEKGGKNKKEGEKKKLEGGKMQEDGDDLIEKGGKNKKEGEKEIKDGKQKINDGEKKKLDGGKMQEDGGDLIEKGGKTKKEGDLIRGEQQERDGRSLIKKGEQQELDGKTLIKKGEQQERDGESLIKKGEQQERDGRSQKKKGEEQERDGESLIKEGEEQERDGRKQIKNGEKLELEEEEREQKKKNSYWGRTLKFVEDNNVFDSVTLVFANTGLECVTDNPIGWFKSLKLVGVELKVLQLNFVKELAFV